ncbi:hypothetical protein LIER_10435 [Lithospermum erythrorhizon]|uniref:Uncharacterized protein n=1 Tax=Lithospermum erythrorhizon TaxID=34254 RepID=A0AAV3PJG0_LITER
MGNQRGGKTHPGPWPKPKPNSNSRPDELPTLPPVANNVSMDDLLREYKVENPIVFVNEPSYADYDDDEDVMAQLIATDRSSHHGVSLSETSSSSEDDEPATDPSVISASDSGSNHVSRGYARPHVLAPCQTRQKAYVYLNEKKKNRSSSLAVRNPSCAKSKEEQSEGVDECPHNAKFNRAWSSFSSNDATTLDVATQAVLGEEREERKVEREALESKIAALEKAQVDTTNEFRQMFASHRDELTQSRISGSN